MFFELATLTSVLQCRKAGVLVRMVTGDNKQTAKSIALKCGILTPAEEANSNAVLEGEEFGKKIRDGKGQVSTFPDVKAFFTDNPQNPCRSIKLDLTLYGQG